MRHERNHHVGLRFFEVRFEHANGGAMIDADRELQYSHELGAAESPAVSQHQVIGVLDANAGVFPQDVNLVEQFLKVRKLNFPRALLRPDGHFQRRGGRPVAAPGVKKSELDSFHACGILAFGRAVNCYSYVKSRLYVSKELNIFVFRTLAAASSACNTRPSIVGIVKCDMHVHSYFSGPCTTPFVRNFCRESYSDPQEVYRRSCSAAA